MFTKKTTHTPYNLRHTLPAATDWFIIITCCHSSVLIGLTLKYRQGSGVIHTWAQLVPWRRLHNGILSAILFKNNFS